MKKPNSTLHLFIFCIIFLLLSSSKSFGQLNGSYTIDPSSSATSKNYQNWESAVGDLLTASRNDGGPAQGAGVNGPVTFTVSDLVYNNVALEITAISGASYTNTITFKSAGGDSTKCVLRNATGTTDATDYIIKLNGADYIKFQEIGFERTGNDLYSTVIRITGDADRNTFLRCFLKGRKIHSNSTNGFQYGIGSIIYFKGNGDSTEITQNRLMYGYNGIYDSIPCIANTISGNIIDTSGASGIYITQQTSLKIMNNTFNMGDFGTSKGQQYVSYAMRVETSPSFVMANNKIFMYAVNATISRAVIVAATNSTKHTPALVYNNMLMNSAGTTSCTGFAVYGSSNVSFLNNNVLITNTFADGAAFHLYPATNGACDSIKLINNNLINKGGGYAITVPDANGSTNLDSVDFNNLYTTGKYIGLWNANKITDLSTWRSTTSRDVNSLNLDPGYQSTTNLHVSSIAINGKAIPYSIIPTDIDNDTRDKATPDIGADEFFPIANDAGVSNLDSPQVFCAGKQIVKATFQNFGYDTIKSVDLYWQINGSSQTTYNWTGKLAPGSSSAPLNLGSFTFSANTAYKFKVWTKNPNNVNDGKNINDTFTITRLPAMSGNYTIGDTSVANYHSFNEAITAMTSRGLCGATIFDVYKGKYIEQLGFGILPGMGASSPITFQSKSNDSTAVLVTLPSTTATGTNIAAIQLRGASYLTFKKISFERTGTNGNAQVLHIINGAHHNNFTNCRMLGIFVTTATVPPNVNLLNILSDQGTDNYNVFRNNFVSNGSANMVFSGVVTAHEIGNVIEGNIFEGATTNSVQLNFNDSVTVKGNIFRNVIVKTVANYSLQLNDCDKGININGNYFKGNNTDTSIWLSGCNGTKASTGKIANNGFIRSYGKSILLDGVDTQNVVFNTIYYTNSASSSAGISTSSATSSNIVIKNNIIVMDNGICYNISNASHVSASDFNNFIIKGGQFAYWGNTYNTLTDLKIATGMESKSTTIDPLFIAANDLHIKNYLLKGKAQPIAGVATDFDGETRNATTPDIGADEFKLVPDDAGIIAVIKPIANTCAGVLDVSAVIKNFGSANLKNAQIDWSVNGAAQSTYSWAGNLVTNATDTVLLGSYNFTTAFNPKFVIKASQPNGNADGIRFNDSIIVTRTLKALPNANAGADITICGGDSIVIGPSAGTGLSYQWTDINQNVIGNTSELTVKPKAKTKYILEVTSIAFGCVNRDTVEIGVNTRPTADAGKDKTICPGSSVQIGATSQNGFTYSWTSSPSGFTSSIANPTDMPGQTTTYILEKVVTGSGCKDMDTVIITMANVPIPKINGKDKLCQSEKQSYTTPQNSGNTYKWLITGGSIISGQNTNTINVQWNVVGVGVLDVIETNAASCFDTTSYFVTVNQNPKADYNIISTCLNSITTFKNLSLDAQTYSWTFGDGASSILKEPQHTYPEAITFNVRLIAKNTTSGCNDTLTKLLPIDPLPVAEFTYAQKSGTTLDFTNTSTVSSGTINSYNWKFGDGGDTSIVKDPSHTFPSSSKYSVTLCVKSAAGCETCITKDVGFSGIKNVTNKNIVVSPNPGSGIFHINSSDKMESVIISNSIGQWVKTYTPLSKDLKIDMTEQPSGLYFININLGGQSQIVKIVKE